MIRLSRPWLGDEEADAVRRVLESGMLVQGERVAAFEAAFGKVANRRHAIAVSNGTTALDLALRVLGVGPGDEVLVPNLTWPSPAHAVKLTGATVVLVDVDPHEWNATGETFARARTDKTKLAIAIEQFGNPCRYEEITAALPGVPVVVDAACSIGSSIDGRVCGSHGIVSTTSLHPRKVITTGEGGLCFTDDDELADKLRWMRNHGQTSPGTFVAASSNYRMTEMQAAIGVVQLGRLEAITKGRQTRATQIRSQIDGLSFQRPPAGGIHNLQTLGAMLPAGTDRATFVANARARGIECGALSYALHTLPSLQEAGSLAKSRALPLEVSTDLVARGVALPLFAQMTEIDASTVAAVVNDLLRQA